LKERTKTILRPFGEYAGDKLLALRLRVSRRRLVPRAVIV